MIVTSLLLIVGAAGLLVLGLWQSSSAMLSGSIGASLLAAIVLVVGSRQGTRTPSELAEQEPADRGGRSGEAEPPERPEPPAPAPETESALAQSPSVTIPVQGSPVRGGVHAAQQEATARQPAEAGDQGEYADDDDPPDEPAAQQVSPADAARVGRMLTEVLVVDGRPRYHLPGCVHLLGRESEPLPVAEAVELGFTPCSLCEPDSALLADARRV